MDFFEAIKARHSYRGAYTAAPVPQDDLVKILDAGIRAPSGCNYQSTNFILVTSPELLGKLTALFDNENLRNAPALIILTTIKHTFDFGLDFEVEDYSAAVENILLAATALGYASCWMDGVTRLGGRGEQIAKLLDVPSGETVRCVLPIGVPQSPGKQAPRKEFSQRVRMA